MGENWAGFYDPGFVSQARKKFAEGTPSRTYLLGHAETDWLVANHDEY